MLILGRLLACLQLCWICRVDFVYGYYRQQRKLIEEIDWSYAGTVNQKNWGKKYPACNGPKQSPINIDEGLTQVNVNLKKLKFQGWDKVAAEGNFIHNTGKTVEINLTNDYRLSGGGLETIFKASKIMFHWGKCNMSSDGSEHSLEGQKFPLEMQIYCYDVDQFSSFEEAVKEKGKLRALSILFEVGLEDNMDYKAVINGVDSVSRFGKQAVLEPFVLLNLLPNSTDKYYTYNGSLSSPPCTETVDWIVFKDKISISENQLASFCEVLTMQQSGYVMLMDYLQNNFREQQYNLPRQVFSSYTGKEEIHEAVCSSEPENVQADPKNYTSLLVTWERPRVVYEAMIEKFAVLYQQLDGEDQTKHEFLTDGYQDLGAILNNLLPNTSYVLQLVAMCTDGLYGKYSDQLIVDMPPDDPDIDLFPELIGTEEFIKEEEEDIEDEAAGSPSTESATHQVRGKEYHVIPTSNYDPEGTGAKSVEAKTTHYFPKGDESSGKGDPQRTFVPTTGAPGKEVPMDSQTMIGRPDPTMEITSTSWRDDPNPALKIQPMNVPGTAEESRPMAPGTESRETSTDSSEDETLLATLKLDSEAEDTSGSIPTTSAASSVPDNISSGQFSGSPEPSTYHVIWPGYAKNASEDSPSPDADDSSKRTWSADRDLPPSQTTDLTAGFVAPTESERSLQASYTDSYIEGSKSASESYSPSTAGSQDTSIADREMPHYSTFTSFPTEIAPHSLSTSPGQHDSASAASEVLSQTTQPVYNGEIPLQPSYSSGVFPLVTPLLSDNQMLNTAPAASGSGMTLHATPVFPSVDVSFEPTLSSSDDVTLLPFPSASFSSEVSHHLYTVSQMSPQFAPAAPQETGSLHASLAMAEGDPLFQPNFGRSSEVAAHQTTAASEMTLFDNQSGALNQWHEVSRVDPSSSDLKMHASSTGSELSSALSGHAGSLQTFPVSSDSAISVHDTFGVSQPGSLSSSPSDALMPKPSVTAQPESLLQPTSALSGDPDWSGAYSGSEFLLPDPDCLPAPNISSSVSVDELPYPTPAFSDANKPLRKSDAFPGDETELKISSLSEMAYRAASTVLPELPTANDVIKPNASLRDTPVPDSRAQATLPGSLAYPATEIWGPDLSALSENHFSVQPLHASSPASDDALLQPVLNATSEPALSVPASSKTLAPSTGWPSPKASAPLDGEALLQTSFPSSDVGSLFTATPAEPGDPILVETSEVYRDNPAILHPGPSDLATSTVSHSTSAPAGFGVLSPASNMPTALFRGLSESSADVPTVFLESELPSRVVPSLFSNDDWLQPTDSEMTSAFPLRVVHGGATPVLPVDILLNTLANERNSPNEAPASLISSVPNASPVLDVPESHVSIHHSLPLPNVFNSGTVASPSKESPVNGTGLLVPHKASSGLFPDASSDAKSRGGGGGGGGDGENDDDNDDDGNDGLSVKSCISCTSDRTAEGKVVDDSSIQVNDVMDQGDFTARSPSISSEDKKQVTDAAALEISPTADRNAVKTTLAQTTPQVPKKHSNLPTVEDHIQTGTTLFPHTSEAKSWAIFTSDEESGSGQGNSDSLNENDTSTDFGIPSLSEQDAEATVETTDDESSPGSPQSLTPFVTSGHSTVFNVSEAEASNSSHESRIGLAEGLESEKKTVIPLVIVSALTFICLVVLVGILIYWRKCFQTAHFYLEDSTSPRVISTPPTPIFPVSDDVGAIPIKHFPKHVADLHASSGFSEEFETLKEFYQEVQSCTVDLGITSDSSNHPDNKNKNRYINIVAYDHSRVKLTQLAEKDGKMTDYINANYVDGYNRPKAYIAAQGPLKSTAEDFWRMIWEHNVEVIVMITNLVEKGRRKCDQYWPADGSEEYGNFLVTQKSIHVLAYYTIRNFTIRNTKIKKGSQKGRPSGRVVTQYHYTQWPDMGVPEYTLPVLTFVRKASHAKRHAVGPVAVHCSAGVGRTGTYIVLDSMLQQIQHEGTVNIFGFLKHIRSQRNYLVQTEEQYVFIHDALVEAILSKETEVPDSQIHGYVNTLLIPGPTGKTRLEKQFKLLSQTNTQQCDYSTALKQCNREKNRTSAIIPVERSRVGISSLTGEGTDYINASYIMGYYQSNEFIITQHPLLHTIKDFWRMIWDHNAQLIVMLPDSQNMAEDEFVYWPNKDEPINCESFKVTMIAEEHKCLSNEEKLIIQDFILEATQDDYVLEVRHFQCPKWPNPDSPISKTFELISIIKDETSSRDGPMIVHDEHGGVTAGTFCALMTLMHQLEKENSIDVYQVARMTNLMRPGIFTDMEQYQFLYKAILSLVSTRQEENPSASLDSNGTALPDGNVAESLESLV
ncbi:receptor-type tyrosine-protein phosphatase zeta isoform X1 [Tachyglossus aculeatus]|uniref:receptor-type tyrosine-protein phosphatase zeta isoform X1 n=1 Tax=Tachyglossus aculeatus TaxID=9261 RepID=UPI0018F5A951|nr:receptor-type tyrosine-protein phosphatase zeta isoform X1 [Tachyglossus aculeatus]